MPETTYQRVAGRPRDKPRVVVAGRGLSVRHWLDTGAVDALVAVDIDVAAGRFTTVVGPSGSGKSTLLRLVACLEWPTAGTLRVDAIDVVAAGRRRRRSLRRRRVGLVSPEPAANLVDHLDAAANLRLAARQRGVVVDVEAALAAVGLAGRGRDAPAALSSGEQLRAAVAMAILGPPAVVVADEPTSALDPANGRAVAALLREVANAGTTLLVATHDPEVAAAADDVVELVHGRRVS
jgi:ABC-type lipoprotein export system ATPase subunit